jgi:hypothetical protein
MPWSVSVGHDQKNQKKRGALKAGATMEEIMEVLKLCVAQGVQACNLGVPILEHELTNGPVLPRPTAAASRLID